MRQTLKNGRDFARACRSLGKFPQRECNLCGHSGRFWPTGDPPRVGAMCPRCGSLERHRLLGLWLRDRKALEGARVLHFAPEPIIASLLQEHANRYESADLDPTKSVDRVLNIEEIDLPDATVDVVVASHVLEHVNDAKALSEIRRILVGNGFAVLMVPLIEGWDRTFEDATITSSADRAILFGQADHVRYYGRDFRDRVREAGFELSEFTAEEPNVTRYGLLRGDKIFVARKAQS